MLTGGALLSDGTGVASADGGVKPGTEVGSGGGTARALDGSGGALPITLGGAGTEELARSDRPCWLAGGKGVDSSPR